MCVTFPQPICSATHFNIGPTANKTTTYCRIRNGFESRAKFQAWAVARAAFVRDGGQPGGASRRLCRHNYFPRCPIKRQRASFCVADMQRICSDRFVLDNYEVRACRGNQRAWAFQQTMREDLVCSATGPIPAAVAPQLPRRNALAAHALSRCSNSAANWIRSMASAGTHCHLRNTWRPCARRFRHSTATLLNRLRASETAMGISSA